MVAAPFRGEASDHAVPDRLASPPPAPIELAGLIVPGGYRLTWTDTSRDGDQYVVERRATGESTFTLLARLQSHKTTYTDTKYVAELIPMYRLRISRNSKLGKPAYCDSRIKAWTYIRIVAYDAMWSSPPTLDDVIGHLYGMAASHGNQPNLNSVLLGDAYGDGGSIYGVVGPHGAEVIPVPELDTGDPQTYKDFFDWVVSTYPGQRYIISFWGHGSGAIGADSVVRASAIGPDRTSGDELTPEEMGQVFGYLTQVTGRKADVFFVCACLTQMMENVYELRDRVKFTVAGESVVGCGCDVLDVLTDNLDKGPKWIADATVACQPTLTYKKDVLYSAVDVGNVKDAAALLDGLAQSLLAYLASDPGHAAQLKAIAAQAQNMNYLGTPDITGAYLDIYDFCSRLKSLGNKDISAKAGLLMAYLKNDLVSSMVLQNDDQGLYGNAHGISVFHVSPDHKGYVSSYDGLAFARDTHWDEYLKAISRLLGMP